MLHQQAVNINADSKGEKKNDKSVYEQDLASAGTVTLGLHRCRIAMCLFRHVPCKPAVYLTWLEQESHATAKIQQVKFSAGQLKLHGAHPV